MHLDLIRRVAKCQDTYIHGGKSDDITFSISRSVMSLFVPGSDLQNMIYTETIYLICKLAGLCQKSQVKHGLHTTIPREGLADCMWSYVHDGHCHGNHSTFMCAAQNLPLHKGWAVYKLNRANCIHCMSTVGTGNTSTVVLMSIWHCQAAKLLLLCKLELACFVRYKHLSCSGAAC